MIPLSISIHISELIGMGPTRIHSVIPHSFPIITNPGRPGSVQSFPNSRPFFAKAQPCINFASLYVAFTRYIIFLQHHHHQQSLDFSISSKPSPSFASLNIKHWSRSHILPYELQRWQSYNITVSVAERTRVWIFLFSVEIV